MDEGYIELRNEIVCQILRDISNHRMEYYKRLDIVNSMLNGVFDWLMIDGRMVLIYYFKKNNKIYEWYKEDIII